LIELSRLPDIRFGLGYAPHRPALGTEGLIAGLSRPDAVGARFPVVPLPETLAMIMALRAARTDVRQGAAGARDRIRAARQDLRAAFDRGVRASMARLVDADAPLRERLTWFWADHFTVAPDMLAYRAGAVAFVDEAIRPNVAGRFAGMLRAVVRHPMMLVYLEQHRSVGPASQIAERSGRGLNENLARELLELHTVGLGGSYGQADVREAAELLTGLGVEWGTGFRFRARAAEPGPETVMSRVYGDGGAPDLADIDTFLEDLAVHPATARHVARKLAVHFVADDPPRDLLADLERVFRETGGDLMAVTTTLMRHPATQAAPPAKIKLPMEVVASGLAALGVTGAQIEAMPPGRLRQVVHHPMRAMGQHFLRAPGPDGWPEAPEAWITPQALAARISWSMTAASRFGRHIDDPRDFLDRTLPGLADDRLRFAVSAAETRAEAIAMTLASSAFNRR
jgi:uncharacterized protein (DUF1800 family)